MSDTAPILVTGASGYIATRIIADLLKAGHSVRGTLRSRARADEVTGLVAADGAPIAGLSFVEADLMQDEGWAQAVSGVKRVLHVASPLPLQRPKDEDTLIRPAREGTLRVLRAAADSGVERVVVTSSVAAIAYGTGGRETAFTEDDWSVTDSDDIGSYEKSKTLAERAAWDFHREHGGFEMATVNPGLVLGPVMGADYGSSAEVVRQLISGQLPLAPRLRYPIVDVRDVSSLHLLAMERPEAVGERFIAAAGHFSFLEMGRVIAGAMPELARRIPKREAPDWMIRLMGRFDPAIRGVTFELGKKREVSHSKAAQLLGWRPRPDAETIVATARSLIDTGAVKL